MDNKLSSLCVDDLQVQLERQKEEAKAKSRELFQQETSLDLSDQELIEEDWTGFMDAYVKFATDEEKMKTLAKQDVVLSLAKYDLFRDHIFFFKFSVFT